MFLNIFYTCIRRINTEHTSNSINVTKRKIRFITGAKLPTRHFRIQFRNPFSHAMFVTDDSQLVVACKCIMNVVETIHIQLQQHKHKAVSKNELI